MIQASYMNRCIAAILSLYEAYHVSRQDPSFVAPRSVIVIAHSMGGVVVRAAATLPNFVPGSIHTLLAVASPLRAPPYLGDSSIDRMYSRIESFWSHLNRVPLNSSPNQTPKVVIAAMVCYDSSTFY
jgi:glycosylphosphatidylinositol deacylase